jgi:hypothetical protein
MGSTHQPLSRKKVALAEREVPPHCQAYSARTGRAEGNPRRQPIRLLVVGRALRSFLNLLFVFGG